MITIKVTEKAALYHLSGIEMETLQYSKSVFNSSFMILKNTLASHRYIVTGIKI